MIKMIQYLNVHGIKVKVDCYIKGLIEELKRDYGVFFTKGEKDFDVSMISDITQAREYIIEGLTIVNEYYKLF